MYNIIWLIVIIVVVGLLAGAVIFLITLIILRFSVAEITTLLRLARVVPGGPLV